MSICSSCRNLRGSAWRDLSPARLSWRMRNVEDEGWDEPDDNAAEVDGGVDW